MLTYRYQSLIEKAGKNIQNRTTTKGNSDTYVLTLRPRRIIQGFLFVHKLSESKVSLPMIEGQLNHEAFHHGYWSN